MVKRLRAKALKLGDKLFNFLDFFMDYSDDKSKNPILRALATVFVCLQVVAAIGVVGMAFVGYVWTWSQIWLIRPSLLAIGVGFIYAILTIGVGFSLGEKDDD